MVSLFFVYFFYLSILYIYYIYYFYVIKYLIIIFINLYMGTGYYINKIRLFLINSYIINRLDYLFNIK